MVMNKELGNLKISVLITVYDAEPYIERCVRSVFAQTYSNLEYVIVDDGTPDKSFEIIEQVMKDFPERAACTHIIHLKQNRGTSTVRNIAIDNATGDFLCFVDADDWMELDGIEKMVARQVATGADVVWGKALMHNDDNEKIVSEPDYKDVEEWRMHYFQFVVGLDMVMWRRLIRRSLLEQNHIRHEEGHHIGDDKQIMPIIAYYAQSFSSIDDIVYHYERRNPNAYCYELVRGAYNLSKLKKDAECMRRIVRFLADKEPAYLEAAELGKLQGLMGHRKKALMSHSREGFRIMNKWIMETPVKYRKQYGWVGLKAALKSNYMYCRLRSALHLKRKFKK